MRPGKLTDGSQATQPKQNVEATERTRLLGNVQQTQAGVGRTKNGSSESDLEEGIRGQEAATPLDQRETVTANAVGFSFTIMVGVISGVNILLNCAEAVRESNSPREKELAGVNVFMNIMLFVVFLGILVARSRSN